MWTDASTSTSVSATPARWRVTPRRYHGTVDETFATLGPDGSVRARGGNVGPPVHPALTTKVVQFNDLDALEEALRAHDVACVLAEPALTNIGIVLPDDGFHDALRELPRARGTLLVIDETHTFSAGPGGFTAAHGLEPDLLTIGKAIGGGVAAGAFGMTDGGRQRARPRRRGLRGRRRRWRHARRQRALARRCARHDGGGADGRRLPTHDRPRKALRRRRRRNRRRAPPALSDRLS